MNQLTYVLITPARNEEAFIEQTIRSVISQTVPPRKWVIVSDGSTDRTDDIVKEYLPGLPVDRTGAHARASRPALRRKGAMFQRGI